MSADEPTLGELARVLSRFEADMRRRLDELTERLDDMVTKDLYEAHRTAVLDRIGGVVGDVEQLRQELDKERAERRADRRVIVGSAMGAALSLVVTVISAALIVAFGLK